METVIDNGILKAVILNKGAELKSLSKGDHHVIWEVDEAFWNKTSPILFPIVGALKDGHYFYNEKEYHLPRHGFARDQVFEVAECSSDRVVFSFKSNDETLKIYPFQFELKIIYTLIKDKLSIQYQIINLSNSEMLYSIGAHPAFAMDGNIEDYSLEFDNNKTLESHQLENDNFNGEIIQIPLSENRLALNYQLFENDAIVLKNYTTTSLVLLKNSQPKIKVDFQDFPFLGIWTKNNAPFICIEPWLGVADHVKTSGNLKDKEGIKTLEANSVDTLEWSISVFD